MRIIMVILILCLELSCKDDFRNEIVGKYFSESKESYITIQIKGENSLTGNHCFVIFNGSRIDCCIDEEYSFKLNKNNDESYEGVLTSCYDELEYPVKVSFEDGFVIFYFTNKNHPFGINEMKLYKEI